MLKIIGEDGVEVAEFKEGKFSFPSGTDKLTKDIFAAIANDTKVKPQDGDPELRMSIAFEQAGYEVTVFPEAEPEGVEY